MSRLTQTEEDRQLLRRAGQIVAVCLVVSLVVNGLILAGKWDDMWSWLLPSSAVNAVDGEMSAEELEDEEMAEQLYTEHQRWVQQREHDEAVARLLEEEKQRAVAEELAALEAQQAALHAAAETANAAAVVPPSGPVAAQP